MEVFMRDTGIVRRIDELGRVVIPKEIRKTLRIKEGDPLEIFTDKDELLFRKYSPVEKMGECSFTILDELCEMTNKNGALVDTDVIIHFNKDKYKELLSRKISIELEKIMDKKDIEKREEGKTVPLCSGDTIASIRQVICPIINSGDLYGAIILFTKDKDEYFTNTDVDLCKLACNVISKYFE